MSHSSESSCSDDNDKPDATPSITANRIKNLTIDAHTGIIITSKRNQPCTPSSIDTSSEEEDEEEEEEEETTTVQQQEIKQENEAETDDETNDFPEEMSTANNVNEEPQNEPETDDETNDFPEEMSTANNVNEETQNEYLDNDEIEDDNKTNTFEFDAEALEFVPTSLPPISNNYTIISQGALSRILRKDQTKRGLTALGLKILIEKQDAEKWYLAVDGFETGRELHYYLNYSTALQLLKQYNHAKYFTLSSNSSPFTYNNNANNNNTTHKPEMVHKLQEMEGKEETVKDKMVANTMMAMGFDAGIVKNIIQQYPDINDISLLIDLYTQYSSSLARNYNPVFRPICQYDGDCDWAKTVQCYSFHPSLQQNNDYQANWTELTMTTTADANKSVTGGPNPVKSNDNTLNVGSQQTIAIFNYELEEKETRKLLYGIVELEKDLKDNDKFEHQLTELLTDEEIFGKYGIEAKDLPQATRSCPEFKDTLKMDKFREIPYKDISNIGSRRNLLKYLRNDEFDIDIDREWDIIQICLLQWKYQQQNIKIQDMIPLLSFPYHTAEVHTISWAYFVHIKPFGFDVGLVFRLKKKNKNDNRVFIDDEYFDFVKVFLDLEELKGQHKLLGKANIMEMEQLFDLQPGHYERIFASKVARSQQMDVTKAWLTDNEEIKEGDGTIDMDEMQIKSRLAQNMINKDKKRIIDELKEEVKNEMIMEEKELKKKKRLLIVKKSNKDVNGLQRRLNDMEYELRSRDRMIKELRQKNQKLENRMVREKEEILKDKRFYNMQYQKYKQKFEKGERTIFDLREKIKEYESNTYEPNAFERNKH